MNWKLQENVLNQGDIEALVTFVRNTTRFTQSENIRKFETLFAKWQSCKYSIFVNSGSSANYLLISAMKELFKWNDGDEIIVPAVTWPTTVTPILQLGLIPVFVDVNLKDLSFDYDKIETSITSKTKAIFVVHLLGFPSNVDRLKQIIDKRDITILEDCCEALGATQNNTKVGNLGMAGTFSTYWGHHITTIEGGMVTTNNEELYNLLLLKRSHGLARELPSRFHAKIKSQYKDIDFNFLFLTDGYNFRNTEFNAVVGLTQIGNIDKYIRIRNANYDKFVSICKQFPDQLITIDSIGKSSFTLQFIFKDYDLKKTFHNAVTVAGIENRPIIGGNLLRQPFLKTFYNEKQFKNSDLIHNNGFYIGNNQFVNEERINSLKKIIEDHFL